MGETTASTLAREHRTRCMEYFFTNLTKADQDIIYWIIQEQDADLARNTITQLVHTIVSRLNSICLPPWIETFDIINDTLGWKVCINSLALQTCEYEYYEVRFPAIISKQSGLTFTVLQDGEVVDEVDMV